jgi:hypothetical protein
MKRFCPLMSRKDAMVECDYEHCAFFNTGSGCCEGRHHK